MSLRSVHKCGGYALIKIESKKIFFEKRSWFYNLLQKIFFEKYQTKMYTFLLNLFANKCIDFLVCRGNNVH